MAKTKTTKNIRIAGWAMVAAALSSEIGGQPGQLQLQPAALLVDPSNIKAGQL